MQIFQGKQIKLLSESYLAKKLTKVGNFQICGRVLSGDFKTSVAPKPSLKYERKNKEQF